MAIFWALGYWLIVILACAASPMLRRLFGDYYIAVWLVWIVLGIVVERTGGFKEEGKQ